MLNIYTRSSYVHKNTLMLASFCNTCKFIVWFSGMHCRLPIMLNFTHEIAKKKKEITKSYFTVTQLHLLTIVAASAVKTMNKKKTKTKKHCGNIMFMHSRPLCNLNAIFEIGAF